MDKNKISSILENISNELAVVKEQLSESLNSTENSQATASSSSSSPSFIGSSSSSASRTGATASSNVEGQMRYIYI